MQQYKNICLFRLVALYHRPLFWQNQDSQQVPHPVIIFIKSKNFNFYIFLKLIILIILINNNL